MKRNVLRLLLVSVLGILASTSMGISANQVAADTSLVVAANDSKDKGTVRIPKNGKEPPTQKDPPKDPPKLPPSTIPGAGNNNGNNNNGGNTNNGNNQNGNNNAGGQCGPACQQAKRCADAGENCNWNNK